MDVTCTAEQHCAEIRSILKLFSDHPQGNAVRFSQVYVYPRHCKLPQMTDPKLPILTNNHFSLFQQINTFIKRVMCSFGSGSAFGSLKKHHFGLTRKLTLWNVYEWEGAQPGDPQSILKCDTLRLEVQKTRSIAIKNWIDNEIRHMVGK